MRFGSKLCVRFKELGELTKKYANLPDSYMRKEMELIEWRTPRGLPQYLPRDVGIKDVRIGLHRPWSPEFKQENTIGMKKKPNALVEPIKDWSFFKGDRVEILVGKDKGKQGHVQQVIQERNWVIVEGLNCKLEAFGPKDKASMYMQKEQPLVVTTDIALIDPSDLKSVQVEWRYTEEGHKVRVSKRSGRIIPIPVQAEETYDYKSKFTYKESDKDTTENELTKVTFTPQLETFDMCLMRSMGVKEERIPQHTYWY